MSFYREQLENYLKGLSVKANTVFDIGGKQGQVKGRTLTWEVENYKVMDLPEFNLEVPYFGGDQADMVFCLEVFEYLIDPKTAMQNIYELLKTGGTAIISFPLVYPLHQEVEFDSLRYTETGIRRLAESSGLQVLQVFYRRPITDGLQRYYAIDGMRAAKGYDHAVTGYVVEIGK